MSVSDGDSPEEALDEVFAFLSPDPSARKWLPGDVLVVPPSHSTLPFARAIRMCVRAHPCLKYPPTLLFRNVYPMITDTFVCICVILSIT